MCLWFVLSRIIFGSNSEGSALETDMDREEENASGFQVKSRDLVPVLGSNPGQSRPIPTDGSKTPKRTLENPEDSAFPAQKKIRLRSSSPALPAGPSTEAARSEAR